MHLHHAFRFVAALGVAGLLLAACGGEPTPSPIAPPATATAAPTATAPGPAAPATTGASAAAPPATSAPVTPAQPIDTAPPGAKVLRFNIGLDPNTTDPQKISFDVEIYWASLAFEGLYDLNDQNQVVPAMAEGAPQISPDGRVYTVTVKSDMKYSDGVPLTAHNFEYAWRRLFDPTVPGRDLASLGYDIQGAQALSEFTDLTDTVKLKQLQDALGVHATDDQRIVFTLKAPVAYFPYILTFYGGWPTRQDMVEKGGANWTQPGTYIGNGPYVLQQWNAGNGAVWTANPYWYRGKPKIDRLETREIADAAVALAAYKNGELDFTGVSPTNLKAVHDDPALSADYVRIPGNETDYLAFNVQKPPFDNLKVRQAFARAFDRADWVDAVLKGAGQPANELMPPGRPGYFPDVTEPPFDAAAARQLLADAGYPNGQGFPALKLSFADTPQTRELFVWFQDQLKTNLNLDVQLDPVELKAYEALLERPETRPLLFLLGWFQDYPDPQDWYSTIFRSDSTVTPTGWKNDQYELADPPSRRRARPGQAPRAL